MDLGQFVNSIFGRKYKSVDIDYSEESRYESVDVHYSANGSFTLSYKNGHKRVTYRNPPGNGACDNFLPGYLVELDRHSPDMTIMDGLKNEAAFILYDEKHETVVVRIEKDHKDPLYIVKNKNHLLCNDNSLGEDVSKIASSYLKLFKHEQNRLDVKYHQQKALLQSNKN